METKENDREAAPPAEAEAAVSRALQDVWDNYARARLCNVPPAEVRVQPADSGRRLPPHRPEEWAAAPGGMLRVTIPRHPLATAPPGQAARRAVVLLMDAFVHAAGETAGTATMSSNGRLHLKAHQALARQLGLEVPIGRGEPGAQSRVPGELDEAAARELGPVLAALDKAIPAYLDAAEQLAEQKKRQRGRPPHLVLSCECRTMRMSPGDWDKGPITDTAGCGKPFQPVS
jgi:hypothetical protein